MVGFVASFGLIAALSSLPAPGPVTGARLASSVIPAALALGHDDTPSPPTSKDSLKNGAIIGALAGTAAGALLGSVGCGVGSLMNPDAECGGAAVGGAIVGAGLGALIGVGIDAMFERAPFPAIRGSGMRKGLRVHIRF